MKKFTLFSFAVLLIASSITAQKVTRKEFRTDQTVRAKTNSQFSDLYIQNSEIGYLTMPYTQLGSGDSYILTGNIVPHYYVFPKNWRVAMVISPQIRMRILQQESWPIRTPSYLPSAAMFVKLNINPEKYKYLSFKYTHHSNGQDGIALNTAGDIESINIRTGNFNTNFAEVALNFGKQNEISGNRYFKIGLEAHSGLIEDFDEEALRKFFPQARLNIRIADSDNMVKFINVVTRSLNRPVESSQELWRVVLDGMFVLDKFIPASEYEGEWYRNFNAEMKVYRKIKNSPNTSFFFSAGYIGHDYYNIYFRDYYPVFRLGLAAGNSFFNKNND